MQLGPTSVTAHLVTASDKLPFKATIFVRIFDLKYISISLKILFTITAIKLHGHHLQDRQPETPSHLRPLGPVHQMHFSPGHFGMSPCCFVFHSQRCHQYYSRSVLPMDMGYLYRRRHYQEVFEAVHSRGMLCQGTYPWWPGGR